MREGIRGEIAEFLVVRKVSRTGIISTVAGNREGEIVEAIPRATNSKLYPRGIVVDSSGNLFISDSYRHSIVKVTPDGLISTVAGGETSTSSADGALAIDSKLKNPWGIALDPAGNLFIVENAGHRVRKVAPNGLTSTVVGDGIAGSSGDGGPANTARLKYPLGIAIDRDGNLFIGDSGNHSIRKVVFGR